MKKKKRLTGKFTMKKRFYRTEIWVELENGDWRKATKADLSEVGF